MKQVFVGKNGAVVEEVPAPQVEPGTVLVAVEHSCISVGTESSGIKTAAQPLWRRALKEPDKVVKVLAAARREGFGKTGAMVRSRLGARHPLGYSAAGRVIAVGAGVNDIAIGDRVACAGSQWAWHAETIRVPRNLIAKIPDRVPSRAASMVTLGAIALQGIRRAAPTLGECFVVVGLGLLGQLTQQMLRADGARVIGLDLDPDRIRRALDDGMEEGFSPADHDAVERVMRLTGGIGVDGVIVTAAAPGNEILSQAFRMCRRKARVVVVGDVGLGIRRADIYEKELDFLISTSYGPGRYERPYEEDGLDYPIGYVRWTENRNMQAVLALMDSKHLRADRLIDRDCGLDDVPAAYAALTSGGAKPPLAVVIAYPQPDAAPRRILPNPAAPPPRPGAVRLAVMGAGGFAQSTLLPVVQGAPDLFSLRAVVNRNGHSAKAAADQFGAALATTDAQEVLGDPNTDAMLIATRHHLHAPLALAALQAGKHVFVEKPLCLTRAELAQIEDFFAKAQGSAPLLQTGYNRRFSPFLREAAQLLAARSNPMMISYRVNAGYFGSDSWVHGAEGGGRNLGEACHFYDLFTFLTGAECVEITAHTLRPKTAHYRSDDNFTAIARFADGSVATLTYTALGASSHPKERMEIYCDGMVISLDDFRRFSVEGPKPRRTESKSPDKGHAEELLRFGQAVQSGGDWPIPLWQQIQAMRMALDVQDQISG